MYSFPFCVSSGAIGALPLLNSRGATEQTYVPVEYIELQFGEFVDTEYIPTNDSGFYCKYLHLTAYNNQPVFAMGMTETISSPPTGCVIVPILGKHNKSYGWEEVINISDSTLGTPDDIPAEGWLNFRNDRTAKLTCSDKEWSTELEDVTTTITKPIYIGMLNRGGVASYQFHGRIYDVKITKGNQIVRHFIPVMDKLGNPCLFEKSENKMYYPRQCVQTLELEWDDI